MVGIALSYDLRFSGASKDRAAYYEAMLDQVEWADNHGFAAVSLLEHHGADDGYLPSPAVFAAALTQRTSNMGIHIVVLAPMHDPIRLAEDLAVLDLLAKGRMAFTIAAGYNPAEFAMYGKQPSDRPKLVTECVSVLKQAWTGQPFEYRNATIRVTPTPYQQPRPPIVLGGMSRPAARRAARIADWYAPSDKTSFEDYREALRELGKPDPGPGHVQALPARFVYVADDPDEAWGKVGPYLMHHNNHYAEMADAAGEDTGFRHANSPEELRGHEAGYRIITPDACIEFARSASPTATLGFFPLCGGMPASYGWDLLHLLEKQVMPALAAP